MLRRSLVFLVLLTAVCCVAQMHSQLQPVAHPGFGNDCTPAGSWYGGSVVGYQLTIVPTNPAGRYTTFGQGIYKASAITATITGEISRKGNVFEGSFLSLTGDDSFVNLPPAANGKMPDLEVGWEVVKMLDCNTLQVTIPFFGSYFATNIWQPGSPWGGPTWLNLKVPFVDPPDIDWIPILTNDTKPIVETYHRVPDKINPALLHK